MNITIRLANGQTINAVAQPDGTYVEAPTQQGLEQSLTRAVGLNSPELTGNLAGALGAHTTIEGECQ